MLIWHFIQQFWHICSCWKIARRTFQCMVALESRGQDFILVEILWSQDLRAKPISFSWWQLILPHTTGATSSPNMNLCCECDTGAYNPWGQGRMATGQAGQGVARMSSYNPWDEGRVAKSFRHDLGHMLHLDAGSRCPIIKALSWPLLNDSSMTTFTQWRFYDLLDSMTVPWSPLLNDSSVISLTQWQFHDQLHLMMVLWSYWLNDSSRITFKQ